ncbi:MAG: hypothetical protein AAFQ94_09280 [Bacteroidota bacterium]
MIRFLNSIKAVLIPMIVLLVAFIIDAGVLFYRAFPEMPLYLKLPASIFMGFAVAFPLLVTSVNSKLLPKAKNGFGFPELFGIFSAIMTLFFFDFFSFPEGKPVSWYTLVMFLSVFVGLIDYLYAHLFVLKNKEENDHQHYKGLYESQLEINETLNGKFSEAKNQLKEATQSLNEYDDTLSELNQKLNEMKKELTCEHCGHLSKTYSAHRNHVNRCKSNPKNQQNESN